MFGSEHYTNCRKGETGGSELLPKLLVRRLNSVSFCSYSYRFKRPIKYLKAPGSSIIQMSKAGRGGGGDTTILEEFLRLQVL